MKKINLIVLSDIQHSSPRITNIIHYLSNSKFSKYIIGADYKNYLNKQDLPVGFFDNVTYISFDRKFNLFRFAKQNFVSKTNTKKVGSIFFINIKKFLVNLLLTLLFPDQYFFSVNSYIRRANKLIEEIDGKVVILTSHPYPTSHIVGFFLKKKFKDRVTWIADYRDLWSLNHNYSFNKLRKIADSKLEKYIVKEADYITTVSRSLADIQSKFLKRKIQIIYNGYSINDNLVEDTTKYFFENLSDHKKYILHVGSLYFNYMNLNLLISGLNQIKNKNFEIHFIGSHSDELEQIITQNKLSNNLKQIGKFNRSQSISIQKKYDYLIMFDSEHDSGVLPLKFFEYIQSTKPIICVGGIANSEVKQILKDLKRGIILEDQNQIFNFLDKKIYLNLETTLNKRDNYKYSYKKTAMNFENFILKNLYS